MTILKYTKQGELIRLNDEELAKYSVEELNEALEELAENDDITHSSYAFDIEVAIAYKENTDSENDFYALVYDNQMEQFRNYTLHGLNRIIDEAIYIAELSQNDEEPHNEEINTLEQALDCLEQYGYDIIPISKYNYELFNVLVEHDESFTNRLSYEAEVEFYRKAKDFKHEAYK